MFELLLFAGKIFLVFVFIAALLILFFSMVAKAQSMKSNLNIEPLHEDWKDTRDQLLAVISDKTELKLLGKAEKKKLKMQKQDAKKEAKKAIPENAKPRVYVLRFDGDVKAKAEESLRHSINAVLQVAKGKLDGDSNSKADEVVIVLESPGGVVNGYGLAAAQLLRLRDAKLHVTVCVDLVAASGGYLMSCVADQIFAAPFAILGSIGVVAQVPNFNRLLKKYDVDFKEYTAGEFKRTVSLFGEVTPKGEEKFREQLEQTHVLFKSFVSRYRPQIDMVKVATGEYWYGEQALELKLIDAIKTSDEYLLEKFQAEQQVYEISYLEKKKLSEKLGDVLGQSLARTFEILQNKVQSSNQKSAQEVL